jgi:dTDP-4-amino-4,6-dideoxy-D-galactose acyltransferase
LSEPCFMLDWDTEFFGFPIARVTDPLLTPQRCAEIDRFCRDHRVRCLYFPACADDPATLALAHERRFRFVDLRMLFGRKLDATFRARIIGSHVRPATDVDLPVLERIAATSHRNTRFFYDGRFPVEKCEELYRTWIRQSVGDPHQHVVVAEADGEVAGYSACVLRERGGGLISLIAVDRSFRGRGIGSDLVNTSLAYFAEGGATEVTVTTQGWNVSSQRVYQQNGFRTSFVELYYHKWFD